VLDEKQKAILRKMKGAGVSMTAIADTLGVARSTLYPQRQLDGLCTALLNIECQKTAARDAENAGHHAVVF
jgi:predicted DNA-binding protein YlxM (UPF0122 family)